MDLKTLSTAELITEVKKLSGSERAPVDPVTGARVIEVGIDRQASIALAIEEARALIQSHGNAFVLIAGDKIQITDRDPRINMVIVEADYFHDEVQELAGMLRCEGVTIKGEDYQAPPYRVTSDKLYGYSKAKRTAQWKDETYGRSFKRINRTTGGKRAWAGKR